MHSDDAQGVLLGLACGNTFGRTVEFSSLGAIGAEFDDTWG